MIPNLFVGAFLIFQVQKINVSLSLSKRLWLVVLNVAHSSQIYILLAPKITMKCKFVVFHSLLSALVTLI